VVPILNTIIFIVFFGGSGIAIAWLFYQGFIPNSKLNAPEPEDKSNQSNKQ
jgi:hypothetical protein